MIFITINNKKYIDLKITEERRNIKNIIIMGTSILASQHP